MYQRKTLLHSGSLVQPASHGHVHEVMRALGHLPAIGVIVTPLHIGYNMLPYFKKLLWETTGQSFPEYSFLKPLEGPRKRGALGILFAVRPHP